MHSDSEGLGWGAAPGILHSSHIQLVTQVQWSVDYTENLKLQAALDLHSTLSCCRSQPTVLPISHGNVGSLRLQGLFLSFAGL